MMSENRFMSKEEHNIEGFDAFTKTNRPHPPHNEPIKIENNKYAYGIWTFKVSGGIAQLEGIYRDGFLNQINQMGYFKRYQSDNTFQYIHDNHNIIKVVEKSQIRDTVNEFIQKEDIHFEYKGLTFLANSESLRETLLKNSPSLFNDAILGHLPNHEKPVLHDTVSEMYFPFENCVVKVTKDAILLVDYSQMENMCIWDEYRIKRPFISPKDYNQAQYSEFINNVAMDQEQKKTNSDRLNAFHSAIGYLLHNFSSPNTSRAVIAYDEEIACKNEPAGGTGKGVFAQALKELRNVATIDGKKIFDKNRFSYQMVTERSQIIYFDDVKPDFDFLMLNSNLTTGWQIEHKNKHPFRYLQGENCKTYITSNSILEGEGTTVSRRQFILEFSPYYSKLVKENKEPIVHIHGNMFFTDEWDQEEWNRFYSFMLTCAKYYLEKDLQFYELRAMKTNKLLQNTSGDFYEWVTSQTFSTDKEIPITTLFNDFKSLYYGNDNELKQRIFTNWLKLFGATKNWKLAIRRSNGHSTGKFILKS